MTRPLLLLLAACSGPTIAETPPAPAGGAAGAPLASPAPTAGAADALESEVADPDPVLGSPTLVAEAAGIRLSRQPYSLGAERGVLFIAEAPRDAVLDVVPYPTVQPFTAFLPGASPGEPATPWVAINGGFYEHSALGGAKAMGLVVSDGAVATPWSEGGGSGIATYGPEPVQILHRTAWTPGAAEAVQSIDRIVDAGKSLVNKRPGKRAAARSAIAVGADHVWLVAAVADASLSETPEGARLRGTVAQGLPLWAFAQVLVDLGATEALNLDGAISTSMAASLGGQDWLLQGEAGTINVLVMRPAG